LSFYSSLFPLAFPAVGIGRPLLLVQRFFVSSLRKTQLDSDYEAGEGRERGKNRETGDEKRYRGSFATERSKWLEKRAKEKKGNEN
jgi:hypothetical protein